MEDASPKEAQSTGSHAEAGPLKDGQRTSGHLADNKAVARVSAAPQKVVCQKKSVNCREKKKFLDEYKRSDFGSELDQEFGGSL